MRIKRRARLASLDPRQNPASSSTIFPFLSPKNEIGKTRKPAVLVDWYRFYGRFMTTLVLINIQTDYPNGSHFFWSNRLVRSSFESMEN